MNRNFRNIFLLRRTYFLTALLFGVVIYLNIIPGCETQKTIRIALSKGKGSESYDNYAKWLSLNYAKVECIDLYHIPLQEALKELEKCDGLLLTGGPDVHPFRYGKAEDSSRCEIDTKRDSLEFQLIKKAAELKLPVLGVCRGQQILNVAYGGSLIVDIPNDYSKSITHRMDNPDSCFHNVTINKNSQFFNLTHSASGLVNSNHHQAVSQLAEVFRAGARTDDGIIESIEWKDTANKPFLMGVQWHPERMNNDPKFSQPIAKTFLEKAIIYKNKK